MPLLALLLPLLLFCATSAAWAHDTWFERLPGAGARLALGTGTVFPKYDSGIDRVYLVASGCRAGDGSAGSLEPADDTPVSLLLRARASPGASTCWVQLSPFEIELAPAVIEVYLREIGASAEVRRVWAERQSRGLPWKERYTKHARIELGAGSSMPTGIGMDVLLDSAGQPARVGQALSFQVLRDGSPLADFAVELRHESIRLGIWRRTDAQGRLSISPPLPGRWLLRGVDLRVSATDADAWDSRFVTLAFQVLPAPAK